MSQTQRATQWSIVIRPVNHHRIAQPHLRRLRFRRPGPQSCLHRLHRADSPRPDHHRECSARSDSSQGRKRNSDLPSFGHHPRDKSRRPSNCRHRPDYKYRTLRRTTQWCTTSCPQYKGSRWRHTHRPDKLPSITEHTVVGTWRTVGGSQIAHREDTVGPTPIGIVVVSVITLLTFGLNTVATSRQRAV